jgi:glycosyltransferase involved in cell wall biosynthesis
LSALPGINLVAYLTGNMGQGVAARAWLQLLLDHGVDVWAVDAPDGAGRSGHDPRFRGLLRPVDEPSPHDVNLFVLNPTCVEPLVRDRVAAVELRGRRNVLLPFWELERLPSDWLETLERFDVVVASSRFIADAVRRWNDGRPSGRRAEIVEVPLPLLRERPAPLDRAAFGLPRDATLFVTSFELASDVVRKNPWGVLEAFARAFPDGDERARLVVKLNNSTIFPEFAGSLARLAAATERDPRIRVLDAVLPHADVLALYACADAYVSLHRAEGVGLGPLEAMSLGVPAIATGWSGNLDYMDEGNAFLVGHGFVPVRAETQLAYSIDRVGEDAVWAEPDVDQAAAWMRHVAEDPGETRRRGVRAAADVAQRQAAIRLDGLMAALARVSPAPETPRAAPPPAAGA